MFLSIGEKDYIWNDDVLGKEIIGFGLTNKGGVQVPYTSQQWNGRIKKHCYWNGSKVVDKTSAQIEAEKEVI